MVKQHKWQNKYEQEVVAHQIDDPLTLGLLAEEEYHKAIGMYIRVNFVEETCVGISSWKQH